MNRFALGLVFLLGSFCALAQDVLTVTDTGGQIATVVYEWTSDASGDATGRTSVVLPGIVWGAVTQPGSGASQPSDDFDVVVYQAFDALGGGVNVIETDVVSGALADRSNAAPLYSAFWPGNVYSVGGMVEIRVSNAGATKTGRIELQVARHLAIRTTDMALVGGTTGQVLQWSAPGVATPVTISGDGSVAAGGAFTIGSGVVDLGMLSATGTASGSTYLRGDYTWAAVAGSGDVSGPASATDNALARYDSTTGKLLQGSGALLDDSNNLSGIGNITLSGTVDGIDIATDVAANTAKVGNATHTGDVTGATALTIATGAVDLGMLSATGSASSSTFLRGDNTWATPAGAGDVTGPGSSTDNALPRFDGTGGKTLQGSSVVVDDSNNLSGIGNITLSGTVDGIDIATDVAANTAKTSNATHTGDVTGATALTIASGAVDLGMLSATGTPSSSTFFRGDNTWTAAPVTLTNTATLTNKRITPRVTALSDGATIAINSDNMDIGTVTLGGNRTLGNPTGTPGSGQTLLVIVTQDGTGSRTLGYGANYRFSTELPSPTLSTGAGDVDYLLFIWNAAASKWDLLAFGEGY